MALELVDKLGRRLTYVRISVTDRCNFRCRYCMPAQGVEWIPHDRIMRYEEIELLVGILTELGVKKIRLTGGEPFVRKGIPQFLRTLRRLFPELELAVTTNASLLANYIDNIKDLNINLNISLDTLDPDKFKDITRIGNLDDVLKGISMWSGLGLPFKINTVLIKGFNEDEIRPLAEFARKMGGVLRFIEFMPLDRSVWSQDSFIPASSIEDLIFSSGDWKELENKTTDTDGPARYFVDLKTGQKIGVIAAVSHHFCETCNRLRITASGELKNCLFASGGVDLLSPLRTGDLDEVKHRILLASWDKPENWKKQISGDRHMSQIGG
ncbi:MAG TPA: GTP 3',8-cyclase MoaA [Acetomicrobium flavidum]|uniref:GTP 3',8-cyclase MoaA n=1 Tax=Acetomicrobium flavidum TaxID=49896 RepID=UPI002B552FCA|nr:GTP 3',8-cyclase MoaA [Acetomicrobium flavidum]